MYKKQLKQKKLWKTSRKTVENLIKLKKPVEKSISFPQVFPQLIVHATVFETA